MKQAMRILIVLLFAISALVFGGCEPDRVTPPTPANFKSLEAKDDVLFNLEASYNLRDIKELRKLLDDDFEFYVSTSDYTQGDLPPRWKFDDEVVATTNLFDPEYDNHWRATNIALKLSYHEWAPVAPEPQYTGEEWFSMDVVYNITVQTAPGVDIKGNNLKARLIIRRSEVDGETIWRIIRWRDIGDDRSGIGGSSGTVSESTWGYIKAWYHGVFSKDLTEKDDVLYNLEMSYIMRNIHQFRRLLDDDFVFFFSEADFNSGDIPISWEKPSEITATTNLFNPNLPGALRATKIDLRLTYPKGSWTEMPQGDDETWYSKEVVYNISVPTVSGIDYRGINLKAQFLIRQVEGGGKQTWQIALWRDIGDDRRSFDVSASSMVQEYTWGGIKGLYKLDE
jgi:hypothetical protein